MSANSRIEWTDHTFNPWMGCTKVSPGCANCYAEGLMDVRYGKVKWGKGKERRRTSEGNWKEPIKWNKDQVVCMECGTWHPHIVWRDVSVDPHLGSCRKCESVQAMVCRRPRVFCASLADWLDDEVPVEWLADLLKLIHETPNLDWLLLTKRPGNWRARIFAALKHMAGDRKFPLACIGWVQGWTQEFLGGPSGEVPQNIWLGTSVEDQVRADERIPELLRIPARVRFLSVEPMLGPVEFSDVSKRSDGVSQLGRKALDGIQWVICGGESGARRRSFDLAWARDLRDQCAAAGVAFFMKQVDKVRDIPEDLLVREFPVVEVGR